MFGSTKFALLATAVAGLQLAGTSAQSISSQCQSTLASIITSSDASCLNAQSLLGLVASTTSNASVVPTINTWLTGLCSKPACTNQTISTVVQNVTSGCQSELSSLGLGSIDANELTALIETAYPTVRKVACLADTKQNNELCVTEFLTGVEGTTGNLSLANIEALGTNLISGSFPNLPSNVTCSNCVKAAYTIVNKDFAGLVPSSVGSSFQSTCGTSFTDGSSPTDITESASSASSSTTVTSNGALPALSFAPAVGIAASVLVTVSSALVVLA